MTRLTKLRKLLPLVAITAISGAACSGGYRITMKTSEGTAPESVVSSAEMPTTSVETVAAAPEGSESGISTPSIVEGTSTSTSGSDTADTGLLDVDSQSEAEPVDEAAASTTSTTVAQNSDDAIPMLPTTAEADVGAEGTASALAPPAESVSSSTTVPETPVEPQPTEAGGTPLVPSPATSAPPRPQEP